MAVEKSGPEEITGERVWSKKIGWKSEYRGPPSMEGVEGGKRRPRRHCCSGRRDCTVISNSGESAPGCGWRSHAVPAEHSFAYSSALAEKRWEVKGQRQRSEVKD